MKKLLMIISPYLLICLLLGTIFICRPLMINNESQNKNKKDSIITKSDSIKNNGNSGETNCKTNGCCNKDYVGN